MIVFVKVTGTVIVLEAVVITVYVTKMDQLLIPTVRVLYLPGYSVLVSVRVLVLVETTGTVTVSVTGYDVTVVIVIVFVKVTGTVIVFDAVVITFDVTNLKLARGRRHKIDYPPGQVVVVIVRVFVVIYTIGFVFVSIDLT